MTKSTKMIREFTKKLAAVECKGIAADAVRIANIQNLNGYADMVDQEWEILRLKVKQLMVLSKKCQAHHEMLAYDSVLKIIGEMTGE